VQKCKSAYGLCKGANVGDIFGSQVSALRPQVRVIWYGYRCGCGEIQVLNLYPNPNTQTRLPTAETRDLKEFSYPYPNPNP
jgi:hypothetical protein